MYQSFFQFSQLPFQITPNPYFFFLSRHHEEALSHLTFGIEERRGFILITGEIGTGKTTLCRLILDRLGPMVKTSLIFNPNLSTLELLQSINQDFGLSGSRSSKKELVDELNKFLLQEREMGGNAVLIIDEAQNLPIQCLEEIRMLSNLETRNDKLLQIVLMGQPELREKLELPELRQLNQRIALRHHLLPLSENEVKGYIQYRLRMAHGEERAFFTPEAIRKIYAYAQGVPRVVNIVCDKALLAAFVGESHVISKQVVNQAIRELEAYRGVRGSVLKKNGFKHGLKEEKPKKVVVRAAFTAALFLLIASFLFLIGNFDLLGRKGFLGDKTGIKPVSSLERERETGGRMDLTRFPDVLNEEENPIQKPRSSSRLPLSVRELPESVDSPFEFGRMQEPLRLTEGLFNPVSSGTLIDQASIRPGDEYVSIRSPNPENTKKDAALTFFSLWVPGFERTGGDQGVRQKDWAFEPFIQEMEFETLHIPMTRENVLRFDSPLLFELEPPGKKKPYWVLLKKINGRTAVVSDPLMGNREYSLQELETLWSKEGIILWKPLAGLRAPMARGDRGSGVRRLQALLGEKGFFKGKIDGIFGSQTLEGVLRLQKHLGIEENGHFNAETAYFLTRLMRGLKSPSLKRIHHSPSYPGIS